VQNEEEKERTFKIKKQLARVMQGTQGLMNLNKTLSKVNIVKKEDEEDKQTVSEQIPSPNDNASSSSSSDPQSELAQKFQIQHDFYTRSNKFSKR